MANSDVNSGKCYSGIISRLLCSGSLPTHPSEQFLESNGIKETDDQKPQKSLQPEANVKQHATSTPGVVARLMGLDSFPIAQKDRSLGSYFRSRSANSIDFFSHFDPIKLGHGQHRRARTAVSFSEGINDGYYSVVLPLEEVDETVGYQEELLKRKRDNVNVGRGKKGENSQVRKVTKKPSKKIEMEVKRRSVCGELGSKTVSQKKDLHGKTRGCLRERRPIVKSKEELIGSNRVKKKNNKVLGHKVHSGKKVHPEDSVPGVDRGSRRRLASQIANSERAHPSGAHSDNGEGEAIMKDKSERKIKNEEICYYKTMVDEICRLTEEDFKENWFCGMVVKFEDFEDMCQQFGQEILEVLLKQFVDELVLLYGRGTNF
ncbi:hypothetical protein CDL12_09271 [Handroanthus impetiginosus]|uniref:DUF3741 domain-containing protein n=1 Tax=Handroanthus impetiginosus TaxID=429701 RepID=A0A2G9HKL6_9LAMI|nr:hypothetical protein CDL12_09271 [Handroanthus impetiginosus]